MSDEPTDYAKDPQPAGQGLTPPLRLALVDGDTTTPLSAEALVVALFACGLLIVKNPAGQIVGLSFDHAKVALLATKLQAQLDQGETLKLQVNRVVQPGGNGVGG